MPRQSTDYKEGALRSAMTVASCRKGSFFLVCPGHKSLPMSVSVTPALSVWTRSTSRNSVSTQSKRTAIWATIGDADENEDGQPSPPATVLEEDDEISLNRAQVESLTVSQLRQQLRLRGKKVGGRKSDLVERLLGSFPSTKDSDGVGDTIAQDVESDIVERLPEGEKSPTRVAAEARGADIIDVTAYLDEEDVGKDTKSSRSTQKAKTEHLSIDKGGEEESVEGEYPSPEIWGEEARIVDDYEGRSLIVDTLSRTVVEYRGSNNTQVQAYVVASRDALKSFLAGGDAGQNETVSSEERVREIQRKREQASKVPAKLDEFEGFDEGDEEGIYKNVLERDYGDWGEFTATGAQLSSAEVQGVLLLSDVYGPFTENTRALADKIAFECQPVVVMVPDLFRGRPWNEDGSNSGVNEDGESYEEWRATHSEHRVSVDIRAAAAALRGRYAVSCIAIWGTCYGGGRALEAASGWYASQKTFLYDIDGNKAPPHVDPVACIAWYPTRYDLSALFGPDNNGFPTTQDGKKREVAIMAVFAEEDDIPGATPEDAAKLKALLENDSRVKDHMVKVFPGQKHGFAHIGLGGAGSGNSEEGIDEVNDFLDNEFGGAGSISMDGGDAEVACLLSTAWMETYSRVFLPTVGTAVKDDVDQSWSTDLKMKDLTEANNRNVREEIEEAVKNAPEVEVDLNRMGQMPFVTDDDTETSEEKEKVLERFDALSTLSPNDDDETFKAKLLQAADDGALDYLLKESYYDDESDAIW